jgi:putative ATPase
MSDIFPLADKIRPQTMADFEGQSHLTEEAHIIHSFLENSTLNSMVFWGPPGTGKTTLSRILVNTLDFPFIEFSATTSRINEVREVMNRAVEIKKIRGKPLVVFVDEIHHFNKHAQDAFLPYIERGDIILIGTTTENPAFKMNRALLSRIKILEFHALERTQLQTILSRALAFIRQQTGLRLELPEGIQNIIFHTSGGDARRLLNLVEILFHVWDKQSAVSEQLVMDVIQKKIAAYDRSGDERYQLISALHKSVRNSDVDAALFWLYRMLEGGEDPLYLLRRLIRISVEDIGLADPEAVRVCLDAKEAYEHLGSPEGDLFLTQAVVYLAAAPKSNSLYLTEQKMKPLVEKYKQAAVPLHIVNPSDFMAARKGAGKEYLYAHDFDEKTTAMSTLPDEVKERDFFVPNDMGFEKKIKDRLHYWQTLKAKLPPPKRD